MWERWSLTTNGLETSDEDENVIEQTCTTGEMDTENAAEGHSSLKCFADECLKKTCNSLCILGAWILWKHRNGCVFEGAAPNLQQALQSYKDEAHLWQFNGAKGLAALENRALAQA